MTPRIKRKRLLRRFVIKTAARVPRLVCSFSVSLSLPAFFLLRLSFCFLISLLSLSLFLLSLPEPTIIKSLTSTSIDPLDGNVYPATKSYEITLRMTRPK